MNREVKEILQRKGGIMSSKERELILRDIKQADICIEELQITNTHLSQELNDMKDRSLWQRIRNA